jgi:hypothetical protein
MIIDAFCLIGSDLPRGIGMKINAGAKMLVNIHYSMAHAPALPDATSIELKLDSSAREFITIPVMNPIWMVDKAMRIKAGQSDATFFFRYKPTIITGGKAMYIQSIYPHMHAYGSKFAVRVIRNGKVRQCLLEVPEWEFGWEQSYWLTTPFRLGVDDELYVECHYDNTKSPAHAANLHSSRDIAWGEGDQEMCVALLGVTKDP